MHARLTGGGKLNEIPCQRDSVGVENPAALSPKDSPAVYNHGANQIIGEEVIIMIPICWRIGVFAYLFTLCLLLAPESFAKTEHRHTAGMTCEHLPSRQIGKAMFYGPGFDGRIMANGQVFDMNALTASSRTLPLGTRARVTNRRSGRSTIVTITDRGRFRAKNVIVDLSVGAAREIGLTEREGVAPVVIKTITCTKMAQVSRSLATKDRPASLSGQ